MKLAHTSALLLGGLAIAVSTSALAGVDIGINLGPPVVVAPAPGYVAPPPPVYYAPAPVVVPPGPGIIIGWHGARYWDVRRYWGRDEWYRHHPDHDRGHWDHGRHGGDEGGRGHWH